MPKQVNQKPINKKTTEEKASTPSIIYVEPKIPTLYVNHAQFMATILDASILLGEIEGADKDGNLRVMPRIKLAMSQEFARELHSLLDRNLAVMAKDNQDFDDNDSVQ